MVLYANARICAGAPVYSTLSCPRSTRVPFLRTIFVKCAALLSGRGRPNSNTVQTIALLQERAKALSSFRATRNSQQIEFQQGGVFMVLRM